MIDNSKPLDIKEYNKWIFEKHKIDLHRAKTRYESVTRKALDDVRASRCWASILNNIGDLGQEYHISTGYDLFADDSPSPDLLIKPFESFVNKTYRKNVLGNKQWPAPPHGTGWILPPHGFIHINDIIRSLLVVKYLDGVTFVVERIREVVRGEEIECNVTLEAREEGYYAAHLNFTIECEIPSQNWDPRLFITQT